MSAQTTPNPLFAPPSNNPFGSSFFTAPNSNTLPGGAEAPPPVAEALMGPADALCRERVWVSADFLYAAASRTVLPPLVTSSPAGSANAGVLGGNSTGVVFGGNQLSGLRPSLRADAGVWVCDCFGFDGSFLTLFEARERYVGTATPGGSILARPVVFGTGAEGAVLLATGTQPGTIRASTDSFTIGGDVNMRYNVRRTKFSTWDVFAGYRYLSLRDRVQVDTDRFVTGIVGPDVRISESDSFYTRNQFHGPQVGFASSHRLFDRLTLSSKLGVAMGVTLTDSVLSGSTATPVGTVDSGLLVSATNAGRYSRSAFSVIPTADAKLGYDLTDWLRFSVGYTFLYWSRVDRAADQIDRTVNPTAGRPSYPSYSTDYWVQGVTFGVELRY